MFITKRRIRKVLKEWIEAHPDVFNTGESDPPWWWVQNFIGELFGWDDNPQNWSEIKKLIPPHVKK